jgi:hypothetical protein
MLLLPGVGKPRLQRGCGDLAVIAGLPPGDLAVIVALPPLAAWSGSQAATA